MQDPDVVDQRAPRPISTLQGVEWGLVLYAVVYAVMRVNDRAKFFLTTQMPVEVEPPHPLSDLEWELAQTWISETTPVNVDMSLDDLPDNTTPTIGDGRHRIWLTRDYHAKFGVPVLSEALLYAGDHLNGNLQGVLSPETSISSLDRIMRWWEEHPRATIPDEHSRVICEAVLALRAGPISYDWFRRLAPWDAWIETLVELYRAGRADEQLLRDALGPAWRDKQDDAHVDPAVVRAMFASLGFTADGRPAQRPRHRRHLLLYRGSTREGRTGPSWTANPDVAHDFARNRQEIGATAHVWQVQVPAEQVLAVFTDEEECLLDLVGLEEVVELASPDAQASRPTRRWIRKLDNRPTFGLRRSQASAPDRGLRL